MPVEIERKYLLKDDSWRKQADQGKKYIQGYLIGSQHASVRIRIEGGAAYLNVKSATLGVRRQEYEYAIPISDANEMLSELCEHPLIEKTRYLIQDHGLCWEIDVFKGENEGLVVAEVELKSEQQQIVCPAWLGEEVSDDPRYYNVSLVKHPYKNW
jgi:adenylate cyclase